MRVFVDIQNFALCAHCMHGIPHNLPRCVSVCVRPRCPAPPHVVLTVHHMSLSPSRLVCPWWAPAPVAQTAHPPIYSGTPFLGCAWVGGGGGGGGGSKLLCALQPLCVDSNLGPEEKQVFSSWAWLCWREFLPEITILVKTKMPNLAPRIA